MTEIIHLLTEDHYCILFYEVARGLLAHLSLCPLFPFGFSGNMQENKNLGRARVAKPIGVV